MRLLLDTHVWLWLLGDVDRLSVDAVAALANADDLVLSAASVWEVTIKHGLGKLPLPVPLVDVVATSYGSAGMRPLPVEAKHAVAVGDLPGLHRDPFDRLLVAQARVEGLTLVTTDPRVQGYDVSVLPV
ncbi:MAG: type II toxin-antitoxin system VapC family toxin [Mycobacteriales bacterium]